MVVVYRVSIMGRGRGGELSKSVRALSERWPLDGVSVVRPKAVDFIQYEALIHSTGSRV